MKVNLLDEAAVRTARLNAEAAARTFQDGWSAWAMSDVVDGEPMPRFRRCKKQPTRYYVEVNGWSLGWVVKWAGRWEGYVCGPGSFEGRKVAIDSTRRGAAQEVVAKVAIYGFGRY